MKRIATIILLLASPLICAAQTPSPATVSKKVEARTGHKLNATKATEFIVPEGVSVGDGLTEDEAIAIALWNNATLQAELTALGLARADLIEAGLLRNPTLTMIFPFSTRILETVANWPFEALWQRPKRIAAAKLEMERVQETLVSRALDLVRDVRLAYADYVAAQTRANLSAQIARERREIAVITNARLRAGDISELEASASVVDARLTEERVARFGQEAMLAQERVRSLLGLPDDAPSPTLIVPPLSLTQSSEQIISVSAATALPSTPALTAEAAPLNELIKQALDARPEIKAGELALEAAGARAKWERSRILVVSAIAKEYGRGANGFEQGPGLQIDLPIFNRNQGSISRAEAEIERAAKQLVAAHQRVVADVREAYLQVMQARVAHELWRMRVLPQLVQDIRLAQVSYRAGDVAYLFVLETARRYSDERLREADFQAAMGRALAQLERSIGRRLIAKP